MYEGFIRARMPLFMVTGVIFALLLGGNIALMKYNLALEMLIRKTRAVDVKKRHIMRDTEDIRRRLALLGRMVPRSMTDVSGREMILRATDALKTRFRGDTVSVSEMTSGLNEIYLPVEISFAFDGYYRLLSRLRSLEHKSFPFFRFSTLSFSRKKGGAASCVIRGDLVMPATGGLLK